MELINSIRRKRDPSKAKILKRFFKTSRGEYGEGDVFLGVTVPTLRKIVKDYPGNIKLSEINILLDSKFHEERLAGLLFLVKLYNKGQNRDKIASFYLKNSSRINSWDLVDLSAPNIVGEYLYSRNKKVPRKLILSKNLWERRIAIVSTLFLIRKNSFSETLRVSKLLLSDNHDLIHKAVGWMLREVGKRDQKILEDFLETNYRGMSRTTLRYAIERMSPSRRRYYLTKQ